MAKSVVKAGAIAATSAAGGALGRVAASRFGGGALGRFAGGALGGATAGVGGELASNIIEGEEGSFQEYATSAASGALFGLGGNALAATAKTRIGQAKISLRNLTHKRPRARITRESASRPEVKSSVRAHESAPPAQPDSGKDLLLIGPSGDPGGRGIIAGQTVRPPLALRPLERRARTADNGVLTSTFGRIEPHHLGTGTPTTEAARRLIRSLGRSTDDAGHALGRNLGGPGGANSGNVFPQAPSPKSSALRFF